MIKGKVNFIVDAGHGSSAKGAASTRLAHIFNVGNASANNYPNAGHTATSNGKKFIAKALPTSAFLNMIGLAKPTLWLGPGSAFFVDQLVHEAALTGYNDGNAITIHNRAVIMSQRHVDMERPGGPLSTEYISSTMSGSGAAFAEKAMRRPAVLLARDAGLTNILPGVKVLEPMEFMTNIREALRRGETFIHEVSQGFALSINYGTHYPHSTFRDCTIQQAMADLMLLPEHVGDIYLNVRSFPIRVGNNYDSSGRQVGYSGDFCDDQVEITWEQIAKDAEMPPEEAAMLAERERTTVTKKIRRVATQSWKLLKYAAIASGATKLILNFPQYIHWSAYKVRGGRNEFNKLHPKVRAYVDKMEETTNLPVVMIGTSAEHDDYIWLS
jgi:adenylosuccinate synthase